MPRFRANTVRSKVSLLIEGRLAPTAGRRAL